MDINAANNRTGAPVDISLKGRQSPVTTRASLFGTDVDLNKLNKTNIQDALSSAHQNQRFIALGNPIKQEVSQKKALEGATLFCETITDTLKSGYITIEDGIKLLEALLSPPGDTASAKGTTITPVLNTVGPELTEYRGLTLQSGKEPKTIDRQSQKTSVEELIFNTLGEMYEHKHSTPLSKSNKFNRL